MEGLQLGRLTEEGIVDVPIITSVAAPTAKLHVPGSPADAADRGVPAKKAVQGSPGERSAVGAPTDGGARTSPLVSSRFAASRFAPSLNLIQDTVSFAGTNLPDDASVGEVRPGSLGVDRAADLLVPSTGPRTTPDAHDPAGIITVGTKTLDLATVDYLPTDGPAARALKLQAAIAAVFGSAMPTGIAAPSTSERLVAARDVVAAQEVVAALDAASPPWMSEADLAAERVEGARERILSQAGAAIDAQAGSLPESVVRLLR